MYSDFAVGGRWKEEHLFHTEAAFTWCLLYQKNHPKGDKVKGHWKSRPSCNTPVDELQLPTKWSVDTFYTCPAWPVWTLIVGKAGTKDFAAEKTAYHQRLWFLFGPDNRINLVDDEPSADEGSTPAEEMAEDAIDEMDTTGNHKKMKQDGLERLDIEQCIVRNYVYPSAVFGRSEISRQKYTQSSTESRHWPRKPPGNP